MRKHNRSSFEDLQQYLDPLLGDLLQKIAELKPISREDFMSANDPEQFLSAAIQMQYLIKFSQGKSNDLSSYYKRMNHLLTAYRLRLSPQIKLNENYLCFHTIFLDVSNSAYQIQALLTRSHELALHTNLINTRSDTLYNFYKIVGERILTAPNTRHKKLLLKFIAEGGNSRNLIKAFVMPYVYGQTIHSYSEIQHTNFNIPRKECWKLATYLKSTFHKIFPEIGLARDVLNDLYRDSYTVMSDPAFEINYNYKHTEISRKEVQVNAETKIRVNIQEIKESPRKNQNFAVNYIHSLEAGVARYITARGCGVVLPIHNSFGVPIDEIKNIRVLIRQAYEQIYIAEHFGFYEAWTAKLKSRKLPIPAQFNLSQLNGVIQN